MRFYLSTMGDLTMEPAPDGSYVTRNENRTAAVAKEYGLGIELAEFCLSDRLDGDAFTETDALIRDKLALVPDCILHGPYNELSPASIDPRALQLTEYRYGQALRDARNYGAKKIVLHSGFNPMSYYPEWYRDRAVAFWRAFLQNHPGDEMFCLENVMENEPQILCDVLDAVDSPRLRLTFDVGHAHSRSDISVFDWLDCWGGRISHFHIHNNFGKIDTHNPLDEGTIDMPRFLARALELCPGATFTVETMEAAPAARWLKAQGFLEKNL